MKRDKRLLAVKETELLDLREDSEAVLRRREAQEAEQLRTRILQILTLQPSGSRKRTAAAGSSATDGSNKFADVKIVEMRFGARESAAHGVEELLNVDLELMHASMGEGVRAIEREILTNGSAEDKECYDYVVNQPAGSSPKLFGNSPYPRDCDENGVCASRLTPSGEGMLLADFRSHPHAAAAKLGLAHVLALRLYSTAAFQSINAPLREIGRTRAHPFPATVMFLSDAIKKLRAVFAASHAGQPVDGASANASGKQQDVKELWRGLRDATVPDEFMRLGGVENAPMSTTSNLEVAMRYSDSASPMLMRLKVDTFLQLGADLHFISAFPAEHEICFPPLTYLKPVGNIEVEAGGKRITVVNVQPFIG